MTILEGIRLAIGAILANKLRSSLTLLGVIIGVASVVAMISVGSGAEKSVTAEFSSLGTNIVYVQPDYASDDQVPPRLKPRDLRSLEVGATYLKDLTPFGNTVAELRYGQHLVTTTVAGTGDRFIDVQSLGLAAGRFFSGQEARLGARLCVIGPQVQEDLAGERSLVGKYLRLDGERFLIIGAMARKAERTMVSDGLTGDNMVYIPLVALQRMTGATDVPFVMGVPVRPELTAAAVDQVKAVIARIYGPDHGLTIASLADTLKTVNKVIGIFTVVLGCLGGISLLVGGIGVMNIMLVAVTERTREIGTRRAVGAKRRDILFQFMVESVTLAGCGGVLGVLFGALLALIVGAVSPIKTAVTGSAVLLAFSCVGTIGVVFGLYPAWRAARLDPIEALRYE